MTTTDVVALIESADQQLKLALQSASLGHEIDLTGFLPWLDRLCATVLEQRANYAVPGLAVLIHRLETLRAILESRAKTGSIAGPPPGAPVAPGHVADPRIASE